MYSGILFTDDFIPEFNNEAANPLYKCQYLMQTCKPLKLPTIHHLRFNFMPMSSKDIEIPPADLADSSLNMDTEAPTTSINEMEGVGTCSKTKCL